MAMYHFESRIFKGETREFYNGFAKVADELFKLQGKGEGTEITAGTKNSDKGLRHSLGVKSTFIPGVEFSYKKTDLEMDGYRCPEEVRLKIRPLTDGIRGLIVSIMGSEFLSDMRVSKLRGYDFDSLEMYASHDKCGLVAHFIDEWGDTEQRERKMTYCLAQERDNTVPPMIFEEIWKKIRLLIRLLYMNKKTATSRSHSLPDSEACPDRSLVELLIGKLKSVRG